MSKFGKHPYYQSPKETQYVHVRERIVKRDDEYVHIGDGLWRKIPKQLDLRSVFQSVGGPCDIEGKGVGHVNG